MFFLHEDAASNDCDADLSHVCDEFRSIRIYSLSGTLFGDDVMLDPTQEESITKL
jgi:hypothetical protein